MIRNVPFFEHQCSSAQVCIPVSPLTFHYIALQGPFTRCELLGYTIIEFEKEVLSQSPEAVKRQ